MDEYDDQSSQSPPSAPAQSPHSRTVPPGTAERQRRHAELKAAANRPVYPPGIHYEAGGGAVGGGRSIAECRSDQQHQVYERSNKIAKKMKEEKRRKELKAQEENKYEQIKAEARQKRIKMEQEQDLRTPPPEDVRARREAFLRRFDNK